MAEGTEPVPASSLGLQEALALTAEDIERMSLPELLWALDLLLGVVSLPALERIERRILSSRGGRA